MTPHRASARYVPWLLALFLSAPPALAEVLKVGGTGAALGPVSRVAEGYRREHPEVEVQVLPSMGSGGGIRALIDGKIDLALSARPPTDAERAAGLSAAEFARTPFVFVARPERGMTGITSDEVVEIFAGRTKRWPDGVPIRLILRPEADADTVLLKGMSPAMESAVGAALAREGMIVAPTDQEAAGLAERSPGALGTSTLAQIQSEGRRLTALVLDGVAPGSATLADGTYRFYKSLYLVTRGDASPPAADFARFLTSPRGGRILAEVGCWGPR